MEMQQVRYFVALAETLNFTRAAERCNVSQPSLTRAIKLLEDEFGGPLFHRERNNTHLTELGRMVRPYLEHLWHEIEAAKSAARSAARMEDSELKIGLMCTIGPAKLIDLMRRFHLKHQGVRLLLTDAGDRRLLEMLHEGSLELAILATPWAEDEQLHYLPLFTEPFLVTFAPGHRFEAMNAVPMRELHGETYLNRANCEYLRQIGDMLVERGVAINEPYSSERDDWVMAMVAAGLGFSFTPECAVGAYGVLARPLVEPEVTRTVNLVTVRGRPHSAAVGAFVREVMQWRAKGCPPGEAAA
ncbi:MAG: LysR family transcriptional regulator [Geminicoccaceae bacterium]